MRRSVVDTAIKTTLAKKNSEMEKLEKSQKLYLRMIGSSGAKLKEKLKSVEEVEKIRMFVTHVPGFCYLRNGEYRKKIANSAVYSTPDPLQCSEKVKAILFTDDELDINKTMCLHLLGTNVQSKFHIQRKDGRLCSYVKAQCSNQTSCVLQPLTHENHPLSELTSNYDKMLPRYILNVNIFHSEISTSSVRICNFNSGSDDEMKKKLKFQVPIYINNDIRIIINSVLEALDTVDSCKLKQLIELACSPEELRNMLNNEEMQEYINELSIKPLVLKPTSYDFITAHLMFDKIPEKGTLEPVAQVLEINENLQLENSLRQIRRALFNSHKELNMHSIVPIEKIGREDKNESLRNSKPLKYLIHKTVKHFKKSPVARKNKVTENETHSINSTTMTDILEKQNNNEKILHYLSNSPKPVNSNKITNDIYSTCSTLNSEKEVSFISDENRPSLSSGRVNTLDSNKFHFQNLSNSQRILVGLKVASLKCRPINMHQFESKKKIDLSQIILPIIYPNNTEIDLKQSLESHCISTPERKPKKVLEVHTSNLENLSRSLLANLRLEISESENKKKVEKFMATLF